MDPAELAFRLDERYGIATRVGLHCAPAAHQTLGTWPGGTVRFSFGAFNTEAETDEAARAVAALCRPER
jgi:selenocysteine lyase/cysteine desulfurase